MSKRPTDHLEPAAKKRGSERQLTKDDGSEDDEYVEKGTIQMASDDVLKTRKIVKARRGTAAPPTTPASGVPAASSNPFAGVNLLGSTAPQTAPFAAKAATATEAANQSLNPTPTSDVQRTTSVEAQDTTKDVAKPKATAESTPDIPAQPVESPVKDSPVLGITAAQPSSLANGSTSQNAFASFASSNAPFASAGANKPLFNFASFTNGSAAQDPSKPKPFSFGPLSNTSTFAFQPAGEAFPAVPSIFGSKTATPDQEDGDADAQQADSIKPALAVLPPETENVTGEEDETQLWAGEGTLYEFTPPQSWKERGKGEMRINKGAGRPARFVLRQRGHHRLLMNANLWADMKITKMDGGKGATFTVVNAAQTSENSEEGQKEAKLQTFAFRVKNAAQMDAFMETVDLHK